MVIYSYPMEKKGKWRSPIVWFAKKEKSTGTFGMYFSCFRPFWVWGVIGSIDRNIGLHNFKFNPTAI